MSDLLWSDRKGSELRCGDGPEYLATLRGVKLVLADPPYAMMKMAEIHRDGRFGTLRRSVDFDQMTPEEHEVLIIRTFAAARLAVEHGWIHLFCRTEDLGRIKSQAEENDLKYHLPFLWGKTNPTPRIRAAGWCSGVETAAVLSHGKAVARDNTTPNWWTGPSSAACNRIHETQKSLDLLTFLLDFYTKPGDLVVDPFGGSCSTLVACLQTGRRCVAIELDPARARAAVVALTEGVSRARAVAAEYGAVRGRQPREGQMAFEEELK